MLPVCGQDGKTYDNKCEMECANVDKKCEGTCPCPYESEDDSLDEDEISKEINWLTFPFPIIPHTKILLFNQLNIYFSWRIYDLWTLKGDAFNLLVTTIFICIINFFIYLHQ